ncbi:hypothetical protein SAMN04488058_104216 [Deinococcus reticulitermitis]|uniref:Uncharacterized protein n=1 Tax=Deinococcus reticulitermitis TaxID=856736 RepID=A0A1H6WLN2_9DEIO|nr:hypothetical protein SAMN04488058_104216 [Deinococcus reticulitermitis]
MRNRDVLSCNEEDENPEINGLDEEVDEGVDDIEVGVDLRTQVERLLSWCVGVAFGRWDVRMALDASLIPELQGPFERLPVVAPAGLVGVDGYPAERGEVAPVEWLQARPNVITLPEGEWHNTREYPLDVAWDGILVSDAGNARDLTQRVRAVLRLVFGERSEAIEDEMTAALRGDAKKAVSLEEYFAHPKHFFASHLKAYSKSRRKAPIYWPLRTRDGGFTAWVYYPRLSRDTLPTLIADVIAPRVAVQRSEVARLQSERASAEGKLFSALGKELDAAQDLLDGLMELEAQLRELVNAGYTVEHDDGVILSAAPLHRVMPWKDLAGMFRNITAGKYPWSHQHGIWVKE